MIIRRIALLLLSTVALFGVATAQNGSFTVVLDAGHGGKDPGAVYGGVNEKEVNLAVALRLGRLISDNCEDVRVVYTRSTDVFVELAERGAIANRANANLFISLHANAVDGNSAVKGASTFIMGMDKSANNLREAMRENAVMKYEEDYTETYEGFDPTSAESYIMFNLMQYAWFDRSLQFASAIQRRYKTDTYFVDRGAKQGPFYVLWKAAMPAVLTEMGFISNEGDRRYMNSERGQNSIARAIFDAFEEYLASATVQSEPPRPEPAGQSEPTVRPAANPSSVGFYVQLCASRGRMDAADARFAPHRDALVEKSIDGWYKYYFGGYRSLEEAVRVRDEAKRGAFRDAFVIALDGDRQITIDEAKKRLAENRQ